MEGRSAAHCGKNRVVSNKVKCRGQRQKTDFAGPEAIPRMRNEQVNHTIWKEGDYNSNSVGVLTLLAASSMEVSGKGNDK
jgi:hypothetical protein